MCQAFYIKQSCKKLSGNPENSLQAYGMVSGVPKGPCRPTAWFREFRKPLAGLRHGFGSSESLWQAYGMVSGVPKASCRLTAWFREALTCLQHHSFSFTYNPMENQ